MGGEQGAGADVALQVFEGGPGQSEAVEGRCAAAHFIQQDEGLRCGRVEDGGSFGHFDHERGATAGEVVAGADAGVDLSLIHISGHSSRRKD